MGKIDFDGIKTNLKQNARPLLAGVTVGPNVVYRLHESKKKKSKKKRRRAYRGYLGAWCPWWMDYDTTHGQHDPKFDPKPAPEVSTVPTCGSDTADGGAVGGAISGGMAVGESVSGYVIGESKDCGIFCESVDDAVGFMVSSKLIEVSPESASDTLNMLRNGVADAISCYTPQLPKRHPFKVFKVSDVPTKEIKQWGYVCESFEESDQDKLVDTPAFKRWFGNSKIVDGNGRPMVVWHGTTRTFTAFDPKVGSVRNPIGLPGEEIGNGLFFTDNYEMAEAFSHGNQPLTCYLRMERPLVIDAHGESWFEPLLKFVDGTGKECKPEDAGKVGKYPYRYVPRHDDLPKDIIDLIEWIRNADTFSYDEIPALVNASFLREEYDGVIIKNVLEGNDAATGVGDDGLYGHKSSTEEWGSDIWPCTDYVVLDPRQIKEWHNNGKFSRSKKNIYEEA